MQMDIHPQIKTTINGYFVSTVSHTGVNETMVFVEGGDMTDLWVDHHNGTKSDMKRSHRDGINWAKSQGTFRKSDYRDKTVKELEVRVTLTNLRTYIAGAVEGARIKTTWTNEQVVDHVMANIHFIK